MNLAEDLKFGRNCPIPEGYTINYTESDKSTWCTFTSSQEDIENAAGLMFHAVDAVSTPKPQHRKNQPWVLESLETPFSSPFRANAYQMQDYQYLASYHFKSAFLFSYFSPAIMDLANRPLPKEFMKTKTKAAPILWIAKNCHATNARQKYIEKLMQYVDVHSYGACLNNQPFPKDKSRTDLLKEYKFYLAMENSNCGDYVTEKLYDTFMMSAVPIVDGPASYDGYIPNNRSVIYADAYPDPKDLADYINYLDQNDTAYMEYFSFRQHALDIAPKDRLDPSFISNWSDPSLHLERSDYCSVCRGLLPWWSYRSNPANKDEYADKNKNSFLLTDETCSSPGKWNYLFEGPPYHPSWEPRPRDEFTRPITFQSNTTVALPSPAITVSPKSTNLVESPVFMANVAFIAFFFVFVTTLLKISSKHSNSAYTQVPTPV
ncbi:hypothetical protein EDC96DRAFT_493787 [Choanephora cucurbitarum]|nr:hypothetical protein EDC96DRAFT_493787 [Choanephora cucurbitarum]